MSPSRGNMSIHHLFHAEEIGASKEPNLDRLVRVFMQISEGIVTRWIQMPKGMLLLVMVPDNPCVRRHLHLRPGRTTVFLGFLRGRRRYPYNSRLRRSARRIRPPGLRCQSRAHASIDAATCDGLNSAPSPHNLTEILTCRKAFQ